MAASNANTVSVVRPNILVNGGYLQGPCMVSPKKHRTPISNDDKFSRLVEYNTKILVKIPLLCPLFLLTYEFFIQSVLLVLVKHTISHIET
jgi:hypothetical protein